MTTFLHALYKLEFCEHIQLSAQSDQISVNIVKSVENEESPVKQYCDSLEFCLQIGILSTQQKWKLGSKKKICWLLPSLLRMETHIYTTVL